MVCYRNSLNLRKETTIKGFSMKRLLLLTLNIVMVTIAWAGDVIPQQASVNARGFMQQRGTMASQIQSADDYVGCEWMYNGV